MDQPISSAELFLCERFRFDRRAGGLFQLDGDAPIAVGSRGLELLGVLVDHAGDLVSKDEIMRAVWPRTVVEDGNLTVQISTLRRVLDNGQSEGSCIQTIPGHGYRFVGTVRRSNANAHHDETAIVQRGARVPPRLSIVVLPIINFSRDPEQEYLADAITNDLTTDLSRIEGSFVISCNTAFTYKSRRVNARQIGRELNVRYILEGSVQCSDDRARINAQLIDAENDGHLWAERFDKDVGDLFALQTEVTSRIAVALNFALVGAEAARPTANPDALDYIFRGRALSAKPPTRDSCAERVRLFEHALVLDPTSAEVQSRLAFSLAGRVVLGMSSTREADLVRAEGLLQEAMKKSSGSALAHWAKGQVLRARHRYADAISEYEAAIDLDRNLPGAYANLGQTKLLTGALDAVMPLLEQAIRLSPRDPDLGYWYDMVGLLHLLQSRTVEAIVWLEKARRASPERPIPRASLAAAYGVLGNYQRAATELAEARSLSGNPTDFQNLAARRANRSFMAPKVRAMFEGTYDVGLRRAGMPEG